MAAGKTLSFLILLSSSIWANNPHQGEHQKKQSITSHIIQTRNYYIKQSPVIVWGFVRIIEFAYLFGSSFAYLPSTLDLLTGIANGDKTQAQAGGINILKTTAKILGTHIAADTSLMLAGLACSYE